MRRKTTKAERAHLARVQALGCLICQRPAQIHHIRANQGMGQRASNYEVIPLCPAHHQDGGHGVAIHAGLKTWESIHGTERELLRKTLERVQRG